MTPEVQSRLFEPFFTTKEPGKGTGLGLSTVYGIVKQSEAFITAHTTVGLGTSMRIFFPVVNEQLADRQPETVEIPARGDETVLLVEDEMGVRNYVREVLEEHGYSVLEAASGSDAIEIARRHPGKINVLFTDMVLPGMNGMEVSRQFLALHPNVPVLCMSGYPERFGAQMNNGMLHLQKPFTSEVLLNRLRKMLDDPRNTSPQ
jgi:two-component system cell cycle sensor histidine kinase/response regulator CckA